MTGKGKNKNAHRCFEFQFPLGLDACDRLLCIKIWSSIVTKLIELENNELLDHRAILFCN